MKQLDANTLVAYVDGELDLETARLVEQHLAEDADAQETARAFRDMATLVRAAHNHVMHEAVPDRLTDVILETPEIDAFTGAGIPEHLVNMILHAPESSAPMPVVASDRSSIIPPASIPLARRRSVAALAMAAAMGAVMLGGGFYAGQSRMSGNAGGAQQVNVISAVSDPAREAAFQEALETKKSEVAMVWSNPQTGVSGAIIPVKTFRRDDGSFCRAFRSVDTGAQPNQPNYGIACREPGPEGRWVKKVEAVAGPDSMPALRY